MSVSTIKQGVGSLIIAEDVVIESPPTFNANSSVRVEFPTVKTGYTRLGCIGLTGSGNSGLVIQEFANSIGKITVYYRNVTSSAITPSTLSIRVLYLRDA